MQLPRVRRPIQRPNARKQGPLGPDCRCRATSIPRSERHLLRVSETADWLEWRDWAHPFLAAPFEVKNGVVTVPDRPGNGIEWDEAAVKRLQRA
jgi:hypothetical protein